MMGATQGSVFDMSLKRDKRNINKRDGFLATKTGGFQKQFNFESVKKCQEQHGYNQHALG
jgi:hypothetical protein